jgi:hypothetical protein
LSSHLIEERINIILICSAIADFTSKPCVQKQRRGPPRYIERCTDIRTSSPPIRSSNPINRPNYTGEHVPPKAQKEILHTSQHPNPTKNIKRTITYSPILPVVPNSLLVSYHLDYRASRQGVSNPEALEPGDCATSLSTTLIVAVRLQGDRSCVDDLM